MFTLQSTGHKLCKFDIKDVCCLSQTIDLVLGDIKFWKPIQYF